MCSLLFSTKKIDNVVFVNEFLQKRGPDNTTVIDHNGHTFIHNLLSMTGSFTTQPLFENNCAVLFNGEIYNYQTFGEYDNDSKCLIPLYNKYGINFTKHLDGEFAICLIDYSKNEIIVSTDIFATKPLWIYVDENDISVSSYESGLLRQGFDKSKIEKIPANTTRIYDLNTKLLKQSSTVYEFDLNDIEIYNQIKADYNLVRRTIVEKGFSALTGSMGVYIQPRTKGPGHGSISRAFYARTSFLKKIIVFDN